MSVPAPKELTPFPASCTFCPGVRGGGRKPRSSSWSRGRLELRRAHQGSSVRGETVAGSLVATETAQGLRADLRADRAGRRERDRNPVTARGDEHRNGSISPADVKPPGCA